jgi:ATP-binding cassette, subfamily C, bacterial
MAKTNPDDDQLKAALLRCRFHLWSVLGFSLAINLLYLASPLYMLQVYNRVVSSGSEITLALLTLILLVAFLALALLDVVRARLLSRLGVRLDRELADAVLAASFASPDTGARGLRDFDSFRQFVSSASVVPLFDLPWAPVYIAVAFLLHPMIGWFALAGCVLLLVLAVANEYVLHNPLRQAGEAGMRSQGFAEMSLRNTEVVQGMGMAAGVTRRWKRDRNRFVGAQLAAADRAGTMSSFIRFVRLSMQSGVLGLGALLAIDHLVSLGAMFAATFLLGRALQPIEQIVGSWRTLVGAHQSYGRLKDLLAADTAKSSSIALPAPLGALSVEGLHYAIPKSQRFAIRSLSFSLEPGEALGVVGPSGAGKSTLLRLLAGVVPATAGAVRLDAADIRNWPREDLGQHIGYLPQDIELFADTVAANIARFTADADAEIIKAAKLAGVHEMILRLPDGYSTQVGESGVVLSGGYRQRIGLARAVFGAPKLVLLDEPSSNLDAAGDWALSECLAGLRRLGSTVVIVSHRPATLATVDKVLVLRDGSLDAFGPRDQIISRLSPSALPAVGERSRG